MQSIFADIFQCFRFTIKIGIDKPLNCIFCITIIKIANTEMIVVIYYYTNN